MRRTLARLRLEPEAETPPRPGPQDRLLATAVVAATAAEVAVREAMTWRPAVAAFGLVLAAAVLWRRTHPLAAAVAGFGGFLLLDAAAIVAGRPPVLIYAGAVVVVLLYALTRWGSGRQVALGGAVALAEWVVAVTTDGTGATDALGGLAVLLLAAAAGLAVRFRSLARVQQRARVRAEERELLARDLHDTVAHHVTAIAVQAQAGRLMAGSDDVEGALTALGRIEQEASRTLAELRAIVGVLRGDGRGAPATAGSDVADLARLATAEASAGLRVEVDQRGVVGDDLPPALSSTLFRLAQESVTNANRHARRATRVHLLLTADPDTVRLCVSDDGEPVSQPSAGGYGLIGMAERVALLGGRLDAGPGPERGWTVQATIPRRPDAP